MGRTSTSKLSRISDDKQKLLRPLFHRPTGCAGKTMACLEASLVIAKTLWYFHFEEIASDAKEKSRLSGDEENEYQLNDIVVSTHNGPWLKFSPRPECTVEFSTRSP